MKDGFAAAMRAELEAMRAELAAAAETGDASAATVELDQQRVGRLSRMDAMQAQAMARATGRRREETLRGIASALARLDSGDFGYCQTCDDPINEARLKIDPTATLCIDCANRAESSA